MSAVELPVVFDCCGARLIGILHASDEPARLGVLVVVGGPQYRVGSHRQFLLLARQLAAHGVPVMRFDYRGMGDSEGGDIGFEQVGPDIRAAVDAFLAAREQHLESVVLWGLCDAASAALMYAHTDSRVTGLVLVNPWIRTEVSEGRAYLRHYYTKRLLDPVFWRELRAGRLELGTRFRSVTHELWKALGLASRADASPARCGPYTERMLDGFEAFQGKVLFVLSGNDLTAAEFRDTTGASRDWRRLMRRPDVSSLSLPEANHTFANERWRDEVSRITLTWLESS